MKHVVQLELPIISIIIMAMLYFTTTKSASLGLVTPVAPVTFVDEYARSQYLKYAGNDPIGEKITVQHGFEWRHETWSGNDKPYQQARQKIDASVNSGISAVHIADEYRKQAQANEKVPQAQYDWAYAIWKTLTPTSSWTEKQTNGLGAFFALTKATSPNTYNYARLRYLLSYQYQGGNQTELGEKLLQRDPKDMEVREHLALEYTSQPYNWRGENRAIQLSKELIQSNPKSARNYAVLAEAYYTAYYENGRHKQDAVAAIAELKKYMSLAKPDEYFYQRAKGRIAELQEKINQ